MKKRIVTLLLATALTLTCACDAQTKAFSEDVSAAETTAEIFEETSSESSEETDVDTEEQVFTSTSIEIIEDMNTDKLVESLQNQFLDKINPMMINVELTSSAYASPIDMVVGISKDVNYLDIDFFGIELYTRDNLTYLHNTAENKWYYMINEDSSDAAAVKISSTLSDFNSIDVNTLAGSFVKNEDGSYINKAKYTGKLTINDAEYYELSTDNYTFYFDTASLEVKKMVGEAVSEAGIITAINATFENAKVAIPEEALIAQVCTNEDFANYFLAMLAGSHAATTPEF